jgi:uncharacterized protein with PQ loop repeat
MYETIGSFLLAFCGVFEAFKAFKTKTCTIGYPMLLTWFIGEICYVIFAIKTRQYILLVNYGANIVFVYLMLYYKLKQRNTNDEILKEFDSTILQ